jgi:protein-S-isoprenylcysteine O-methyltransferase Ste14
MTITTTMVVAYALIAFYFVMERALRQGQPAALHLQPGTADVGSSKLLWASGVLDILLVAVAAPIMNAHNRIGSCCCGSKTSPGQCDIVVGWLGVTIMLSGLALRYWAARTLGNFYTRTLQVLNGHQIVTQAPYHVIRHPGYLGTMLMEVGAGLAVTNWIVLIVVTVSACSSRAYRIGAEEKMLNARFGQEYQTYADKTFKLVPFVY